MSDIISIIHEQRNALSDCGRDLFKGTETIEELAAIFRTPQGAEFCETHNFPDLDTWRRLNEAYDLTRFGVYVDAGNITLTNVADVTLIGETSGVLRYDELERHTVVVMHGAKANVTASGWAIVFVKQSDSCEVVTEVKNRAKIL